MAPMSQPLPGRRLLACGVVGRGLDRPVDGRRRLAAQLRGRALDGLEGEPLDRALAREPQERFATALEMADALETCGTASASEVGAWVADMVSSLN